MSAVEPKPSSPSLAGHEVPRVRRLAVLGSSISMIVRPPRSGDPYPQLLERRLAEATGDVWLVDNMSRVAAIIGDARAYVPRLVASQPDVIVIHYGHVEAVYRPQSRASWLRVHEVKPGSGAVAATINQLRTQFALVKRRLRIRRQWTSLPTFRRAADQLLDYLGKETRATFVLVEANPGDARVERWGPGTQAQIAAYNAVMREVADAHGAVWIPLAQFVREPVERFIADGTHLTSEGHTALAVAIARAVEGAAEQNGRGAAPRP
jgi:lysophospholipase L1-like esterase